MTLMEDHGHQPPRREEPEPGIEVRSLGPDGAPGVRDLCFGFRFGGIVPNRRHDRDVLRYQHLDRVALDTSDLELASDHGRELLDDVTA
jgi:hypothetical protein